MTGLCSTVLGISLPFGVYQALSRGNQYYLSRLNRSMFNEDIDKYFLYVADIVGASEHYYKTEFRQTLALLSSFTGTLLC
jgi:hypothetical protein